MDRNEARAGVRRIAIDLARIRSSSLERQAIRSFIAGALYALDRAIDLDFKARSYESVSSSYTGEVTRTLRRIAHGSDPSRTWLGGFYFNSGLQHLAGAYHRLLKVVTGKDHVSVPCLVDLGVAQGRLQRSNLDALMAVHSDVNHLKHDPVGRLKERKVSGFALAIRAAEQAVALLRKRPSRRARS